MAEAVEKRAKICAHPAIENELGSAWPGKNFCQDKTCIIFLLLQLNTPLYLEDATFVFGDSA